MLKHLKIENFGLFDEVSIALKQEFTVVTGETGSGKSLLFKAFKFLLGEKIHLEARPKPEEPMRVEATICTKNPAHLSGILQQYNLKLPNEIPTITAIARTLNPQGRSKAYLNNMPITLSCLQAIMQSWLCIHDQHQHIQLTQAKQQRQCLDDFANHPELLLQTQKHYQQWEQCRQQLAEIEQRLQELPSSAECSAILDESHAIGLDNMPFDSLFDKHKQLHGQKDLLRDCKAALEILDAESPNSVQQQLYQAQQHLCKHLDKFAQLEGAVNNLEEMRTNLQDVQHSLYDLSQLDAYDAEQELAQIENSLQSAYQFARKHRVQTGELVDFLKKTKANLNTRTQLKEQLAQVQAQLDQSLKSYKSSALNLHQSRSIAAQRLSALLQDRLALLDLNEAQLHIEITPTTQLYHHGQDNIVFYFSANRGFSAQPLDRSASGGELARLALLMRLSTPSNPPKLLLFDEADVGVSGAIASRIGALFKQCGEHQPLICITHSAQVAAKADAHWHIAKKHQEHFSLARLAVLDSSQHVRAVANLLSAEAITPATLANATELCTS